MQKNNLYNPAEIEPRWQKTWEDNKMYEAEDFSDKSRKFILIEFPYPSGAGLHVGHVRSYTALDVLSRKLRMEGFNVLYPIGWDAFGLPTENYAIKNKIHPMEATKKNIAVFKRQMKELGTSFDWSREINTTDPAYYKWTQWIFLKFFENGLAYKAKMPINWCLSCKIGLANEEVVNGRCERCGGEVEKREKEQWMLAITKYAERLLKDLDTVDYLEKIKIQQRNWIGKSEGALVKFKIVNKIEKQNKKQIIGAGAFLETKNGNFLFQLRDNQAPTHPNKISIFAGAIEKGENSFLALKRELKEELNLEIDQFDFEDLGYFESPREKNKFFQIFKIKKIEKEKLVLNEGEAIVEMTLEEALENKNVIDPVKNFIKFNFKNLKKTFIGAGALIETTKGTFLFQKRDKNAKRSPGKIGLFGGHIKKSDNNLLETLKRELREEINLKIKDEDIKEIIDIESSKNNDKFLKLFHIKNVEKKDLQLKEGEAILEMSLEEAMNNSELANHARKSVEYFIQSTKYYLDVFTTRIDTIFGCTYCVIAPEHPLITNYELRITNYQEVKKYIEKSKKKSDLERTELAKEKTGVELKGIKAINPFNNEELPIFIADYVLSSYGTGAVMAVPAHDQRDFEFAKKYGLAIKQSIAPYNFDKDNPSRKEKENTVRKVVHIILENKKSEVLVLKLKGKEWGDKKPKTLIIGGIEEGESLEETTKREIKEETGYVDIEIIKIHPIEIQAEFFAIHKDVNRYVKIRGVFCKLKSEKKIALNEKEKKLHDIVWIKYDKLLNFLNIPDDILLAKFFIDNIETFTDDGVLINSQNYSGLKSVKAREKMTEWLSENNLGGKKVNYKLRDWVFSRQRYWGEPIPVIHCEKCGMVPVAEKDLPVVLPDVESYEPTDTGESPLAKIADWVNVKCQKCGGEAKRETDTMPNWAGSSWYFLRYIDPKNDKALAGSEKLKYWMPVDLYNGGMEHTTLHLLYSRFWNKFLFDIGVAPTSEPYAKRISHGMVLAEDGKKMSKSLGNVINPDQVVKEFGADSLRMYEMFMGPYAEQIPWSTNGVVGVRRFLDRIYRLSKKVQISKKNSDIEVSLNKTIKKVTQDINDFRFNTAISQMMILLNEIENQESLSKNSFKKFLIILSPFAPHITEELWSKLGNNKSIFKQSWPMFDESKLKEDKQEIIVQVNGKLRDKIMIDFDAGEEAVKEKALSSEKAAKHIGAKEIRKAIYVKGRLINFVI